MVLEPVVEVGDGFLLLELVGAGDPEAQEGVQVEGVDLVGTLEGDDCVVVLIVLLVKLTHESPSFCIFCLLLHLSL